MASVCGQPDAYEKYVCSIALAIDSGFLYVQALAYERAARHFLALGQKARAEPFFQKACQGNEEWKGMAKLRKLQAELELIYPSTL